MKEHLLLLAFLLGLTIEVFAQETPTRGFLLTRVTTAQRNDVANFPASTPRGTQVYDTDTKSFWYWDGTKWIEQTNSIKADTTNDSWKNDAVNAQVRLTYKSNGSTVRDAGTEFVIADNGNVGLGTTSPTSKLSIYQPVVSGNPTPFRINNQVQGSFVRLAELYAPNNLAADNGSEIILGTTGSSGNATEWRFKYAADNSDNNRGEFAFFGTVNPAISYLKNGRVGIGTTSPQELLDVNGKIRINTVEEIGSNITGNPLIWDPTGKTIMRSAAVYSNASTNSIAPDNTSNSTTAIAYKLYVFFNNSCGASFINEYLITGASGNNNWAITFVAGLTGSGVSTFTQNSKTSVSVVNNIPACQDGSGASTASYTITIGAGTGIVTFSDGKAFRVRRERLF